VREGEVKGLAGPMSNCFLYTPVKYLTTFTATNINDSDTCQSATSVHTWLWQPLNEI